MKYICLSLFFAASIIASDNDSSQSEGAKELLRTHLHDTVKHIAMVQAVRGLIPIASNIALSPLSRSEKEDDIRLLLCSSLNQEQKRRILDARAEKDTLKFHRRSPFAPIEGVKCFINFSAGHMTCSYDYCSTDYTPIKFETVFKEFDACLAEHIAAQQADQRVIEKALEQ